MRGVAWDHCPERGLGGRTGQMVPPYVISESETSSEDQEGRNNSHRPTAAQSSAKSAGIALGLPLVARALSF